MPHKQIATEMIEADLKRAGFAVRYSLNGDLLVSLNREITAQEVRTALYDEGYDDCQFRAKSAGGSDVIVEAVTG